MDNEIKILDCNGLQCPGPIMKVNETLKKMKVPKTKEHKEKISKANKGLKRSDEVKLKIKKSMKNIEKVLCPYCSKYFLPWHYSRYHGKKCKNYLEDL